MFGPNGIGESNAEQAALCEACRAGAAAQVVVALGRG
jgi:hypothetical protein